MEGQRQESGESVGGRNVRNGIHTGAEGNSGGALKRRGVRVPCHLKEYTHLELGAIVEEG
jgi:hypothetical protein